MGSEYQKKYMTVSDSTIQAKTLCKFVKSLRNTFRKSGKKLATIRGRNSGTALEKGQKVDRAAVFKHPEAALSATSYVIVFLIKLVQHYMLENM